MLYRSLKYIGDESVRIGNVITMYYPGTEVGNVCTIASLLLSYRNTILEEYTEQINVSHYAKASMEYYYPNACKMFYDKVCSKISNAVYTIVELIYEEVLEGVAEKDGLSIMEYPLLLTTKNYN